MCLLKVLRTLFYI
uniref:Uncharacterized protein n=1 Tax=Rhizophora mucronata TaxID=61149 RepID=A0A2P2R1L0_RHIMU